MTRTGIFFHYQEGNRLRDFPEALSEILSKDNVFLYDAYYPLKAESDFDLEVLPMEALYAVHTPAMIEQLRHTSDFEGARMSVSSTVAAAIRIAKNEIDNAFVFTGYGDHHAGSHFYGGGCLLNGAAVAIAQLRQHFQARRFAIVDTDAHHGDGTWELFANDPQVLYLCFCSGDYPERNNNINVRVPFRTTDEEYLQMVRGTIAKLEKHKPEIIFWNWGYDGTQGDYGDIGLSPDFHARLAVEIKGVADRLSKGRLVVVLCGGSRRDLAYQIIPQLIEVLPT